LRPDIRRQNKESEEHDSCYIANHDILNGLTQGNTLTFVTGGTSCICNA
jgi:hypothetical protein